MTRLARRNGWEEVDWGGVSLSFLGFWGVERFKKGFWCFQSFGFDFARLCGLEPVFFKSDFARLSGLEPVLILLAMRG